MGRVNKKGRSAGTGRFVALHHSMLNTPAWAALRPGERSLYVVIAAIYDGSNNGRLGLGVRDAAKKARINKDTATQAFRRLMDLGFIEMAQEDEYVRSPGEGGLRRAVEWRLTQYRCDRTGHMATRAFARWQPENAEACPSDPDGVSLDFGQSPPEVLPSVPRIRTKAVA